MLLSMNEQPQSNPVAATIKRCERSFNMDNVEPRVFPCCKPSEVGRLPPPAIGAVDARTL